MIPFLFSECGMGNPTGERAVLRSWILDFRFWRLAFAVILAGCAARPFPAYHPLAGRAPRRRTVVQALQRFPRRVDRPFFASWRVAGRSIPLVGRLTGAPGGKLRITCISELGTLIFRAQATPAGVRILNLGSGIPSGPPTELARQLHLALAAPAIAAANSRAILRENHEARLDCRDAAGNRYQFIFAGAAGRLRDCCVQLAAGGEADFRYRHYDGCAMPAELRLRYRNPAGSCILDFTK